MWALDLAALIGVPQPWASGGVVEAVLAALAASLVAREAARGGERPARVGVVRALAFGAVAGVGVLVLTKAAWVLAAGAPHARGVASLAPVLGFAARVAAGERTTRAFRERLRDAALWSLAGVCLVPALAVVLFMAVLAAPARGVSGAGSVAFVSALVIAVARVARVPSEGALVLGGLLGSRLAWLRTLGFSGGGARLRRWEEAWRRLAVLAGERSHRVAVALASPEPTFLLDWHRPAVQLVVDRSGVLRVASAMPAPELVEALAVAPEGVLAARELHPYLVGAADVHAATRSLELREASAAALLRDDESKEIVGVLYALRGDRSPLTETEARAFRRLADVVAASIASGSEPVIAARLKGA